MDFLIWEDQDMRDRLFPFTLTRPVWDLRVGILTIREKWEKILGRKAQIGDADSMDPRVPAIPGNVLPDPSLPSVALGDPNILTEWLRSSTVRRIRHPWDITRENALEIILDFDLIRGQRASAPLSSSNRLVCPERIFVEPGTRVEHAILNGATGPIYLGTGAEIMEGAIIRGPFALGEGAVVKMGAVIYGASTVGPGCIAGGEIKNSVLSGFTNKSHQGYLGDSVIGYWCNLGAGSSCSNVKNNAGEIRCWNEPRKEFLAAGGKCGLMMGDYSRAAIQSAFNSGCVTGVSCNIFGAGLSPAYIPSFSWGMEGKERYRLDRALQDIRRWKKMKDRDLDEEEVRTLTRIFEQNI
jgi:UDP-N-acetylglucosamine diphosphorylase/glucosamine-1-phosphate N-acetyltransferase